MQRAAHFDCVSANVSVNLDVSMVTAQTNNSMEPQQQLKVRTFPAGIRRPPQSRRAAAAAVELAVLLPVLTTLLVLAVDFGRVMQHYAVLTNCARNAALYAADPTSGTLSHYGSLSAAALADWPSTWTPAPTVTQLASVTDAQGFTYVQVQVSWTFTPITSFLGAAGTQALERTVRMRAAPLLPN